MEDRRLTRGCLVYQGSWAGLRGSARRAIWWWAGRTSLWVLWGPGVGVVGRRLELSAAESERERVRDKWENELGVSATCSVRTKQVKWVQTACFSEGHYCTSGYFHRATEFIAYEELQRSVVFSLPRVLGCAGQTFGGRPRRKIEDMKHIVSEPVRLKRNAKWKPYQKGIKETTASAFNSLRPQFPAAAAALITPLIVGYRKLINSNHLPFLFLNMSLVAIFCYVSWLCHYVL